MRLHQVKPKNLNKKKKRIGRGGKRGTYSGKGMKGQKSRASGVPRPELRDFIKKIPKKRGYKFKAQPKPYIVNLKELDKNFKENEIISPETLFERGLIGKLNNRRVKILGEGKLTKKVKIRGCSFSKSAAKVLGIEIKEKKIKVRKNIRKSENKKIEKKVEKPKKKEEIKKETKSKEKKTS